MSKLNRREFKELLAEWNLRFNDNLILEASKIEIDEVKKAIDSTGKNGEDEYNKLVSLNRKAAQDQYFLKIIANTFNAGENHSIEDIEVQYEKYLRFIDREWREGREAFVDVPGGLRTSLSPELTTYDDMIKFFDAKLSMNLKTKVYVKCLSQEDKNTDFEVIMNDNEWIICYPKTIKGSISLARSFWNGERLEYDDTIRGGIGKRVGEMSWCTSVVSGGNMFLNYHRKMNLHMYYCIKKNMRIEDADRKLCISLLKSGGRVEFNEGYSSVDGNNDPQKKETFIGYIGNRYDKLLNDAEKPERLEIDQAAYYESISLEQYRILRAASEDNIEDFSRETHDILRYSRDRKEIALDCANDNLFTIKKRIVKMLLSYPHLWANIDLEEVIKKLADEEDDRIRRKVAEMEIYHDKIFFEDIVRKLSEDRNTGVRYSIAEKENCPVDILEKLSADSEYSVRQAVAGNYNCPIHILENLASDRNKYVKISIIDNESCTPDLLLIILRNLEEDTSQLSTGIKDGVKTKIVMHPNCPSNILTALASECKNRGDNSGWNILQAIVSHQNCPGSVLRILSSNRSHSIRKLIAVHPNCPLDILQTLSKDRNSAVKRNAINNPNYNEPSETTESQSGFIDIDDHLQTFVPSDQNENILYSYIKLLIK